MQDSLKVPSPAPTPRPKLTDLRVKGSHHIFRKEAVIENINLHRDGNMAKPYQVKQVFA